MLKVGHRGARGEAPENTIRGFITGIRHGADAVEMDVRLTRDGKAVIMHDARLKRLAGADRLVSGMTSKEIGKLSVDGERIPFLGDALDAIGGRSNPIFIELKSAGLERIVASEVASRGLSDSAVVISFNVRSVLNMRKINKNIQIGMVCKPVSDIMKRARNVRPEYVFAGIEYGLDSRGIDALHKICAKVVAWTVNYEELAMRCMELGVDGIETDYPKRIFSAI